MHEFSGVTAHFMKMEEETNPELQSALLSFDRFTGSHTGVIIKSINLNASSGKTNDSSSLGIFVVVDKFSVYFSSKQRSEHC